jgi:CheY-like chemotaxis protein
MKASIAAEAETAAAEGAGGLTMHARRIAELEGLLEECLAQGRSRVDRLARALGEIEAATGMSFDEASGALRALRLWVDTFKPKLASQLASARALHSLAQQARPLVLAVDDDEYQLKLVEQLLLRAGGEPRPELLCARSGGEALALSRQHHPDLVLMDINLPDVDGLKTTRRLKATDGLAHVPVIMMSGHSGRDIVVASLRAGAADFVVKPFDRTTLLEKVRRFL